VREGSVVDLTIEGGRLVVHPVRARKFELVELLRGVRPRNLHAEIGTGAPRGRESW
jgi:antitoxin component of MazEF toxin-antitoxin module